MESIVESHIMKLVLGPRYMDNKHLKEKLREYREGLIDDYNCFLYIPPEGKKEGLK